LETLNLGSQKVLFAIPSHRHTEKKKKNALDDDDTDDVFFSPLREDFETTYDEKLQTHSQSR
jgi:hypothetical protein